MKKIILVAGATGNLGQRIVTALLSCGAEVRAIVREESDNEKVNHLIKLGVNVAKVNMLDVKAVAAAMADVACVISVLSGLREVIIDAQKVLLDAAVAAGVPRFIPSDYSLDFTKFSDGENRNLDLRREFHTYLDAAPIAATSIFNGAFADMLTGQMPLILFKQKLVLYWGNANHRMVFTTMDDTAAFTAHAAVDAATPRYLSIAGSQCSPREINTIMNEVAAKKFRLFRAGGMGLLSMIIKIARKLAPGKRELYPAWQGMQYMRNMIDERAMLERPDNQRYPAIKWTTAKDVLSTHQKNL
jgi:nucleoside-diphosphate-sugar epimerase